MMENEREKDRTRRRDESREINKWVEDREDGEETGKREREPKRGRNE